MHENAEWNLHEYQAKQLFAEYGYPFYRQVLL